MAERDILKESHKAELGNLWVYTLGNFWILKQVKDLNTENWHTLAERSQIEVKCRDSGSFNCSDTILQMEGEGFFSEGLRFQLKINWY